MIVLPAAFVSLPLLLEQPTDALSDLDTLFSNMPPALLAPMEGMDEEQIMIYLLAVYFFAPFFLIIPIMVSSVIAADSFVGEKERKTLEALLYTPTTDTELFVAKTLTALLPAIAVSWICFVLYTAIVNLAGSPTMGGLFFPTGMWIVLILWVVPAAAGLGLGVMVLVSSKAKSFQEAYQIGSAVVVPIVLLVFGQLAGVLYFSLPVVLLIGLVLWGVDATLIMLGVRTFRRGELVARI